MRISLESLYIDNTLGFEGLNTYSKINIQIILLLWYFYQVVICNNSPEFIHDTHRERNKYLF